MPHRAKQKDAQVKQIVATALAEDLGPEGVRGDVTSRYFIPERDQAYGAIISRQRGTLSGAAVVKEVFRQISPKIKVLTSLPDGTLMLPGAIVFEVVGPIRALLAAERTALNFVQHLSGVATLTRQYVEAVRSTKAVILDTRKTTPGWRFLEKAAVVHGGGQNHRLGLHDQVLVKDNHIAAVAGNYQVLFNAVQRIRKDHPGMKIEFEADTLQQVRAYAGLGIDAVLLDNMSPSILKKAVAIVKKYPKPCVTEASGGVNLKSVKEIARCGVDFISIGALTHSAPAVDFGFDF